MKQIKGSRQQRRGSTLVIGVPDLQRTFDELRSGGGLLLQVMELDRPPTEILLISDLRFSEIAREYRESDQELN